MSSKPYIITEPAEVAKRYGNDKEKIQQAAMLGMVDPTAAVMAGMYIDRVERDAQAARARANKSTVAQDTFPQIAMAPQAAMAPQMAPTEAGVAALPVPDDMVPDEYAGGGIVAFSNGGTPFYAEGNRPFQTTEGQTRRQYTQEELDEYRRLKEMGLLQGLNELVVDPLRQFFATTGRRDLQRGMTQGYNAQPTPGSLPADVRRADISEMVAVPRPDGTVVAPNVASPAVSATTPSGQQPTPRTGAPSEVALITPQGQRLIPRQGMSVEDFKARQKEFGITDNVDADLKKQIDALAAGSKSEREQAKYMAMLQAGLGIMGGTSPNALQNISAGAQRGIAQYASDIKDIKKEERDLMKLRGELARAEDARKRGDFKTFQEANDKAQALEISLMNAQSTRMTAQAQQRIAEARATGSGITPNQMANLRMKAEKEVEELA